MNNIIIPFRANLLESGTPPFANTKSLSFDGIDDFVSCGNIAELSNATAFTISGWYKQTTLNQFKSLFDFYVDANNGFVVYTYTDGNMYLQIYPGVGVDSYCYFDYSTVVTANTWFNIAVIYDGGGATNADKLKCYIDGVQVSLSFVQTIPTSTGAGINTFNICRSNRFGNIYGEGGADEIALWDSVIPIGDVWDGSGAATDLSLLATPPLHWYRMGDNGSWKSPQWLIPNNENFAANKVSNYSLDFDGVDDKVDVSSISSLNNASALSFSGWVKKTSGNVVGLECYTTALDRIILYWWSDNKVYFSVRNGSSSPAASSLLTIYDWNHICGTFDGGTNTIKLYINGVLVNTQISQPSVTSATIGNNFHIGLSNGSIYSNGNIDEVSLYDSELSASQINDIYNGGAPTTISGAIAHYKMGEDATFSGGVWTVPDAVGSNDGTSANMTIEDRIGEAPNSSNNAVSFNMDEVDRVNDTP